MYYLCLIPVLYLGNLHHSQYCDKLKKIVEFLGNRLTTDEITNIWNLQVRTRISYLHIHGLFALLFLGRSKPGISRQHTQSSISSHWEAHFVTDGPSIPADSEGTT